MPRINTNKLKIFVIAALEKVGTPPNAAEQVAQHLVEANLAGHDSHGVVRLSKYCHDAREGHVVPAAEPHIAIQTPLAAVVDGQQGWGPVTAWFATELAVKMARGQGLAMVSVRGAYHVGRIGPYVEHVAQAGYIGVAFCNVHGGARVMPWGGTDARLGTNPIAIAVPTQNVPIVVDMATSAVAEGKVRLAKIDGRHVPWGWVLDGDGQFSTNPDDAYEKGGLAPLGGDQGHKGYCLAVALDMLGGLLSNAGCGSMTTKRGNGMLLQAFDPALFGDPDDFRTRIEAYARYLKSSGRRKGVEAVLLPGEFERQCRQRRIREGVTVSPEIWQQLEQLCVTMDIPSPL